MTQAVRAIKTEMNITSNQQQLKKNINPKIILGDITGGLLAAIIALPLCLAFGVASELGATAGLYGAIVCGIIAAMFGGTPGMISGPTGPVTVMVASIASAHPQKPSLALAAGIAAGLFQILLGKLKTGQLIQYIPHPVVSGFMTGIGVIIVSIQLLPLIGLNTQGEVFSVFENLFEQFDKINTSALFLGLATISTIYIVQKLPLKIPPLLVALAGGTFASLALNLDVPRIGNIPTGLPPISLPVFHINDLHIVLSNGLAIAIVASIDSLLTAVMVDKETKSRHHSDKELIAQGAGNIAAGLVGGITGSGTTMPSMINVSSGGRTALSGIISGLILLLVLLGLGKIASQIPLSVLAGILITVGISIMDKKSLFAIKNAPRSDSLVMILVLILTVFVDLMMAVGVGVALASTLFAKRMADTKRSTIKRIETLEEWRSLCDELPQELRKSLYLYDFIGPLFFGEVKNFLDSSPKIEKANIVILRFHNVPFIDQSGAYALDDAIDEWKKASKTILFVGLKNSVKQVLENISFEFDHSNDFSTVEDALNFIATELASNTTSSDTTT